MNDKLAIDTLKISGVAAINKANSGHPGIVLGAATMMHTLFTRHMKYDPKNPKWINRDRFILSAGHGSALLYAQLRLLGHITTDDMKSFRQWESITPGHPEYGMTTGVESTTGPLGQGIATSVGVALAETSLSARFNEIDHHTFVICGDGDLQEGVAMEAMSFAGQNKLNKLIVMHDSNDIQLDTPVAKVFSENLKMRMEAIGWDYQKVDNNVEAIDAALTKAKKSDKPSFIEVKTIIGEGATKAGTSDVHGAPLGTDIETVKKSLNWTTDEFEIPAEVTKQYEETIFKRGAEEFAKFKASKELNDFLKSEKVSINLEVSKNVATRASSGEVIKHLNETVPNWIGGSADLTGSTKAAGGDGEYSIQNRKGRNILFGVREFAMGAIANGLALHSNFKPFVSTFFVFSDYLKPAMRLSALMKLPVTFIFTHDSIFVGEDGPTHEPIEHLAMMRSIPNLNTIRPADENEVLGAYEIALNATETPTAIILTRQNIVSQDKSQKDISKGAYVIHEGSSDKTIVATGSEVSLAIEVAKKTDATVVSVPSTNLFDKQGKAYIDSLIKDWNKTLTLEVASTFGWAKYGKHNFGVDRFGESAPGDRIYKELGFTVENLTNIVNKM